jgi:hypothetical protein
MVLADPGLVVAQGVEPLDQFDVAFQRERRVLAGTMEGGEDDAEGQAAVGRKMYS